jgi:hypothetical protein
MQVASPSSPFVVRMLAISAPGRMTQLNGTGSADAGDANSPVNNPNFEAADRQRMNVPKLICLLPFSTRH